jgi:hypothetical protein
LQTLEEGTLLLEFGVPNAIQVSEARYLDRGDPVCLTRIFESSRWLAALPASQPDELADQDVDESRVQAAEAQARGRLEVVNLAGAGCLLQDALISTDAVRERTP